MPKINRQNSDTAAHEARLALAIIMTLLVFASTSRAQAETATDVYESLESIRLQAIEFARHRAQATRARDRIEVEAVALDPRLKLPACTEPPSASAAPGATTLGRTAVAVECRGEHPWRLYVRLQVRAWGQVVVARRSLSRGTTIEAADLKLAEHDLAQFSYTFASEPGQIVGRTLRRGIRANEIVNLEALSRRTLVQTGQQITLTAGDDQFSISMAGTALSDGAKGDLIRVRNSSSNRIVEGMVVAPGMVAVGPRNSGN